MNYKLIVYIISVLVTTFGVSSLDLNRFFKQGKVIEANVMAVVLILAIAELLSNFLINFMEVSKIHFDQTKNWERNRDFGFGRVCNWSGCRGNASEF